MAETEWGWISMACMYNVFSCMKLYIYIICTHTQTHTEGEREREREREGHGDVDRDGDRDRQNKFGNHQDNSGFFYYTLQ
jgi:hypothetical protein